MIYDVAFMEEHGVAPLEERSSLVTVAACRPTGEGRERLRRLLEAYHCKPVAFREVTAEELRIIRQRAVASTGVRFVSAPTRAAYGVSIDGGPAGAPAVSLANSLLNEALSFGASDVHIEAHHGQVLTRFRVDGRLHPASSFTSRSSSGDPLAALSARLKALAGLNAAERRRPQDGRFSVTIGGESVDVRFSSMPTIGGESLVLRVFRGAGERPAVEELGMPAAILERVVRTVESQAGFLLASGPTGSGKTTTLHAALRRISTGERKIITIEDPVEYHLPEIDQVQINAAAGLTFASALGRVLRQDVNVIMVGEIRDPDTASLAARAAISGHLVLSTVHARSAAGVARRLLDLGVEEPILGLVPPLVVAQRLVRKLCGECRVVRRPTEAEAAWCAASGEAPPERVGAPVGCAACRQTGYRGRTGIFEAAGGGLATTLREDGIRKLAALATSFEEVAWATAG